MNGGLFEGFEKQSAESWTEQLKKDLRGEALDSLLWKTQGIEGQAFYTSEDLDLEPFNYDHFSQDSTLFGDRYWVNYQLVAVVNEKEANQKALHALANGANGILFSTSLIPDWSILMKDIQPEYCHVSFQLDQHVDSASFFDSYKDYLVNSGKELEKIFGFSNKAHNAHSSIGHLRNLGFNIESGSNASQQLALSMAQMIDAIDQLTEAGKSKEDCLRSVFFHVSLTNDFFLEIARHRALRRLFGSVCSGYGVVDCSAEIISSTPNWTSPIDDPHSFMLQATTQAMSAIVGGTDGLIIQPFYSVFPSNPGLAERIARNVSSILSEESYLNKMVDPAAGSYYIERMSEDLYNQSMELLQRIEANGGISKTDVGQLIAEA